MCLAQSQAESHHDDVRVRHINHNDDFRERNLHNPHFCFTVGPNWHPHVIDILAARELHIPYSMDAQLCQF